MLARIFSTITGVVLIVYGVIAAISPLPLGLPLIVVGFLMIAGANPAARPLIRKMRRRWRWFDKLVKMAARRSPAQFGDVARTTRPIDCAYEASAPDDQQKDEKA